MPQLYTVPAGQPIARESAALMLRQCGAEGLANAIAFVPTRRSCITLRDAFSDLLRGQSAMLPRMVPLADIGNELLTLLGPSHLPDITRIAPAMPESERRFLLARQIMAFEKRRLSRSISVEYALTLADSLVALQDECTRAGIALTQEALRPLITRDVADHWRQALQFLSILTDSWPAIEQGLGMVTAAAREVAALQLLARVWAEQSPTQPVYLIGSTASQKATTGLMKTIADSPQGHVVLPGMPSAPNDWAEITAGHPLYHLKQFLAVWPIEPRDVQVLGKESPNLWLEALAPVSAQPAWQGRGLPSHHHLRLVPTAHVEEEARVIALLLREGLEQPPHARMGLITPDEGLMQRVAALLARDGIAPSRLGGGTLADTESGSLWLAIAQVIAGGGKPLHLLEFLRHPHINLDDNILLMLEHGWRGINRVGNGKLPFHSAETKSHSEYVLILSLVHCFSSLFELSTDINKWIEKVRSLLEIAKARSGDGDEAVAEALAGLSGADNLGLLDAEDFLALLHDAFSARRREAGLGATPRVVMLTPVEARLEHFDRVILASMSEDIWPGVTATNPWLNLAMQRALGLPTPEEAVSLTAHDVLMHGSAREVFLTYAARKEGSPTTRSRFIERVVTRLAAASIEMDAIAAPHYNIWAARREEAPSYVPELPVRPTPPSAMRPTRLPVTDIDRLFDDPYSLYAKHILQLKPLKDIDAEPEASDFGNLAHKAIQALSHHWQAEMRPATEAELAEIASVALRALSERPNIDLFWRARLMGGLRFVNHMECERRNTGASILPEESIEGTIAGITLHGRIDRLEARDGVLTVVDYKTGKPPSLGDLKKGKALQLLTYAMLTEGAQAVEYWQLPRLGETGEITYAAMEGDVNLADIRARLEESLQQMMQNETPLLATPDERFGSDYDGISRFDEWAG